MKTFSKIWSFLKKHPFVLLSIILAVVIILMRECSSEKEPETKVETYIVKVPVTNWKHDTIIKPIYYPKKIDTAAIIEDYFSKVYYDTIIYIKDTAEINLNAILSKNRIDSVNVSINYKVPLKTPKKAKLYVGGSISNGIAGFNPGLSPEILLITKKDHGYKLGYDIINQRIEVGYIVPIRKVVK